ncbi:Aste57867_4503 [Aphanomyces stellatus]|uniref:Aste57867_4503 protein n=1 Tax=Aphanomyces stellatus TaxID=120398 RepID=A0A485KFI8_9STRA|nr:hypothetical protein As57867_004490 [Aphanomyces stellatus]VFT81613.1 Aste57867_4503 [Aphanomyces stellatus]
MATARTRVDAIAFTMLGCTCDVPLFRQKYLRSHRTDGTKVVRCFPHCCPNHTELSFCAASLAVAITATPPALLKHCLVFLHFEASYDPTHASGDSIDAHVVLADQRSKENPRGAWIPTQPTAAKGNAIAFEYAAPDGGAWHYGWLGGSSIHQRLSWHRLKAYLFLRRENDFVVLASVASPPFFVMSYRRSCKSCQANVATSRVMCDCVGMFRLGDNLLHDVLTNGTTQVDILHSNERRESASLIPQSNVQTNYLSEIETRFQMLHALLARTPLDVTCGNIIQASVESMTSGSKSLVGGKSTGNTQQGGGGTHIAAICVDIVWALVRYQPTVAWRDHASHLLDQKQLCVAYEDWLTRLMKVVLQVLHARGIEPDNFFRSVAALLPTAPEPTATKHQALYSPLFLFFVAQLREIYMALEYAAPAPMMPPAHPCDGHWRLHAESSHLYVFSKAPNLLTMMRSLTMGERLQIITSTKSFFVRSGIAMFPTVWTELVLDKSPRVFRVFPNGETSMSGWGNFLHGDYVAWKDNNAICIRLASWPTNDGDDETGDRHSHESQERNIFYVLNIRVEQSNDRLALVCDAAIGTPTAATMLENWTLHERNTHLENARAPVPWLQLQSIYNRVS